MTIGKPNQRFGLTTVLLHANQIGFASFDGKNLLAFDLPTIAAQTIERVVHRVTIMRAVHDPEDDALAADLIAPLQHFGFAKERAHGFGDFQVLTGVIQTIQRESADTVLRICQRIKLGEQAQRDGQRECDPKQ